MQETNNVEYQRAAPDHLLSDFIKCYWSVHNPDQEEKTFSILPDGHFDLLFRSVNGHIGISLSGLWNQETTSVVPGKSTTFGISFKLPASEYILKESIAGLLNAEKEVPQDFWGLEPADLSDFNGLTEMLNRKIQQRLCKNIDNRKLHLFSTLYATDGAITAEEVSNTILWSNRQISQYFKDQFGISLKSYCTILRYRASFDHLNDKELYPQQNYSDQAHFIREVKKYSGVTPGVLAENENNRFIQLSTLKKE
ncbi:helix-turn-helix domain-containing protein [Pedobacter caeni]|uniref:HTH araC/xylS-type domain-containing protein n=1 Tax=Pedobacter caeni TaxID=288992 RepID=A0A1M5JJ75_9SPHI|nr:AraC family transcriptional regulator [Pedobacter caeni]SHG40636.1 hypothetical protein SAMN04488522_105382 [Pedobacter caeni]